MARQVKFKDKMFNLVGPQLKPGDAAPDFECVSGLDIVRLSDTPKAVRFFSVVDLVNRLETEKAVGKQGRLAQRLTLMDAVVLDELGYLPVSANGGALLFHLTSNVVGGALIIPMFVGADFERYYVLFIACACLLAIVLRNSTS